MAGSAITKERDPIAREARLLPLRKAAATPAAEVAAQVVTAAAGATATQDEATKADDGTDYGTDVFTPSPEELALINQHALVALTADQLFCFRILACDNQPDRHYERILPRSLELLAATYAGRTQIQNHAWLAQFQTARIFRAGVDTDPMVSSEIAAEPYTYMYVDVYMLRLADNKADRLKIAAGITKETSVGFKLDWSQVKCSICQEAVFGASGWGWDSDCPHMPGKTYDKGLCIGEIHPHDKLEGLENSFVAVPAQPRAGVMARKDAEGADERQLIIERKQAMLNQTKLAAALASGDPAQIKEAMADATPEQKKAMADAMGAMPERTKTASGTAATPPATKDDGEDDVDEEDEDEQGDEIDESKDAPAAPTPEKTAAPVEAPTPVKADDIAQSVVKLLGLGAGQTLGQAVASEVTKQLGEAPMVKELTELKDGLAQLKAQVEAKVATPTTPGALQAGMGGKAATPATPSQITPSNGKHAVANAIADGLLN